MKRIIKIFAVLVLGAAFACTKEGKETLSPGTFEIDMDTYSVLGADQTKQVLFVPVKTNISESEWKMESSAPDWCKPGFSISSQKGLMIALAENTDKEAHRRAQVNVKAGASDYTLTVVQTGYGPAIIVTPVTVGPDGGEEIVLEVTSNVELDESCFASPAIKEEDNGETEEGKPAGPWIRYAGLASVKSFAKTRVLYEVAENVLPDKRVATIQLKAAHEADKSADTKVTITQNHISVDDATVFSDNKIEVLDVVANQQGKWTSGGDRALIDGNYETFYHSLTIDEGDTSFPVIWEFQLPGDKRLDYISIMHRGAGSGSGGHYRGKIGKFKVYYKVNPTDAYTEAQAFDFSEAGGYQSANLDTPIENATWVKLEIETADSGTHQDGNYICCAEVEFFTSNRVEVNDWIDRIFTDRSCSALKAGVTKNQIVKMYGEAPYLAVNVAIPLFNNEYSGKEYEFRVHSYDPYSDNRVNQALFTRIYSAMDNPTGVEVKAGTDILVCVDQIPEGQTVSLAVYGDAGDGPNYGSAGENESSDQNTKLVAGINTIRIVADGMAYVMNTVKQADPKHPDTTPLSAYKPVKVHILPGCGKVQGYFEPARYASDEQADKAYQDLLNACTYKYFMVKGSKCLFLFHTNQLKTDWPKSIRSGIGVWDDIVRWQLETMGLDKLTWFNNHMMAVTSTNKDVYMDASNRRVQLAASTIANICSREKMRSPGEGNQGTIWGPAHEMGHVNQMAINWLSTTESSNNLFSNYCVMKVHEDRYYKDFWSRGKTIKDLADSYANAEPWATMGSGNYQGEDPELHMRLNWQLWNYFHNCGVDTEFFPKLFEYLRQNPLSNSTAASYWGKTEEPGEAQLQYYVAVSKVANMDFTEFFDAWGFFRTIDTQYEQYYTRLYKVDDAMINKYKAQVRDLHLAQAPAIQYLEDRTNQGGTTYSQMGHFSSFKAKTSISKNPSCTVSGQMVTVSDCDQAVAVEVRSGDSVSSDNLKYFSNLYSFTVPSKVNLSGCSFWAVQWDGTRKKITRK